jgi:tetratricopeptide (TPR) repeat protein
VLGEALRAAQGSGDHHALGSVHGHLMTLHHISGEGREAVEHGWASIQAYRSTEDRLNALVSLAGIMLDLGAVEVAEEAYGLALERLEGGYFRAFALEGYAHAAALRGDCREYEQRYRRVYAQGWAAGGVEFRAQAYVYRGRAYEALGDPVEAGRWYAKAASFAERASSKVHQLEAEEALARLDGGTGAPRGPAPLALPARTLETVRGGLGALRRELTGLAS